MKGLEPPRLSAPDPKSGAAANYATSALLFTYFLNPTGATAVFASSQKMPHPHYYLLILNPTGASTVFASSQKMPHPHYYLLIF